MWFVLALAASVLWGLVYTLHEQVYRHISVLTSIVFDSVLLLLLVGVFALFTETFQKDLVTIASSKSVALLLGAQIVVALAATVLIAFSINYRNATVAGLVEMTYPLFIVLFSWLLFRENNLNLGTIVGGLCIFVGVAVVYFFNR